MSFIKELGKQKKNFLLFLLLLLTQSARLCKSSSPGCQGAGSHLGAVCLRTRPGLTGSRGANSNTGCRKSVISPDKKLKDLKTFLLLRMHKLNVLIILFNWKDTELFSSEKYNQTVWAKCFSQKERVQKDQTCISVCGLFLSQVVRAELSDGFQISSLKPIQKTQNMSKSKTQCSVPQSSWTHS